MRILLFIIASCIAFCLFNKSILWDTQELKYHSDALVGQSIEDRESLLTSEDKIFLEQVFENIWSEDRFSYYLIIDNKINAQTISNIIPMYDWRKKIPYDRSKAIVFSKNPVTGWNSYYIEIKKRGIKRARYDLSMTDLESFPTENLSSALVKEKTLDYLQQQEMARQHLNSSDKVTKEMWLAFRAVAFLSALFLMLAFIASLIVSGKKGWAYRWASGIFSGIFWEIMRDR